MIVRKNEAVDLPLKGAFLLKPFLFTDGRGAFSKLFTRELLASKGAGCEFCEQFTSVSRRLVVRGLHYQRGRFSQARLVWCPLGEIFDVIVDLRKSSPTFGKWASATLSGKEGNAVYVPRGFAHGFMAVSDEAVVSYLADNDYSGENERGIIYNDPDLGIAWPAESGVSLSDKDRKWGSFRECEKFD
jgi:dTDP-4-dehydrorhamnose 3,5-epimerase